MRWRWDGGEQRSQDAGSTGHRATGHPVRPPSTRRYPQLTQAGIIKDKHPDLPVFVYTGFGWAMGLNAAVDAIWHDPSYKDFFLQVGTGSGRLNLGFALLL